MSGHFDLKTDMFIATCTQILSVSNRDILSEITDNCFTSIHDTSLKFEECSTSVERTLGYSLCNDGFEQKSLYELLSPDSLKVVAERHSQSKAAHFTKKKWDWPLQIIDFDMINRILNKIVLDVWNKFENLIFFIKFWPNKIQKAIWTRLNCWIRTAATSTVCSTFIATWKTKSFANIKSWGIDPMIIY